MLLLMLRVAPAFSFSQVFRLQVFPDQVAVFLFLFRVVGQTVGEIGSWISRSRVEKSDSSKTFEFKIMPFINN